MGYGNARLRDCGNAGLRDSEGGLQSSVFSLRSPTRGFTLLELLVVIAIIGILTAIIVPTASRIQERGREVRCMSNLRQLHTAAVVYANNNGRRLPWAASISQEEADGTPVGARHGWVASVIGGDRDPTGHAWWYEKDGFQGTASIRAGRMFHYVGQEGDESVYICPTMARIARRELSGERRTVTRSYGMNSRMSYARLDRIDGASRIMLFADQGFRDMGGRRFLTGGDNGPEVVGEEEDDDDRLYWRRHHARIDGSIDHGAEWIGAYHGSHANVQGENGGRGNVVFVDGHTESVSYRDTDWVARGDWEAGRRIQ